VTGGSENCRLRLSSALNSYLRCWLQPLGFLSDEFVGCVKACRLLHHRPHGTVLLFGETDGFLQRCRINFVSHDHMVDSDCCKHLRRTLRLIGLNPHFISCDLLVVLLAEHRDDIERRTASQPCGNQFDRFGACTSGCIVQQQVMAAPALGYKLALLPKWLSQFDFGCDHDCLLLSVSIKYTNKCRKLDFVTKKIGLDPKGRKEGYNFGLTIASTCS